MNNIVGSNFKKKNLLKSLIAGTMNNAQDPQEKCKCAFSVESKPSLSVNGV